MTSGNHHRRNARWLRQVRSWSGVLLLVTALCGGVRLAPSFGEEFDAEETTEVLEYAQRLSDAGPRLTNRRARGELATVPALTATADGCTPSRRGVRRAGSTDRSSHVLANGLRAPLRC